MNNNKPVSYIPHNKIIKIYFKQLTVVYCRPVESSSSQPTRDRLRRRRWSIGACHFHRARCRWSFAK